MFHLADGTLRTLCDEPGATPLAAPHHLAGCTPCQARLEGLRSTAQSAGAALAAEPLAAAEMAAAHAVVIAAG